MPWRNLKSICSVQSLSHAQFFATPWTAAHQASLSITNSWSLLKLVHRVSDAIQPSHPLSLPSPPAFNHSQHQGLFQGVFHIRWPKYRSFSFSISPSNEYSELISFRIDWLDLLTAQGTLKSLLQHYSSKASIFLALSLLHSPTLTSMHDYWKNHSFDYVDCVGKMMSRLFNTLSRFVIAFLPKSKHLLISWLQSPSAVILELKKIKSLTVSTVCPSICNEVMGQDAVILVF